MCSNKYKCMLFSMCLTGTIVFNRLKRIAIGNCTIRQKYTIERWGKSKESVFTLLDKYSIFWVQFCQINFLRVFFNLSSNVVEKYEQDLVVTFLLIWSIILVDPTPRRTVFVCDQRTKTARSEDELETESVSAVEVVL